MSGVLFFFFVAQNRNKSVGSSVTAIATLVRVDRREVRRLRKGSASSGFVRQLSQGGIARLRSEMKGNLMSKILIAFAALCAGLSLMASGSYGAAEDKEHRDVLDSAARPVNPVVQWDRVLLVIIRTPKAQ